MVIPVVVVPTVVVPAAAIPRIPVTVIPGVSVPVVVIPAVVIPGASPRVMPVEVTVPAHVFVGTVVRYRRESKPNINTGFVVLNNYGCVARGGDFDIGTAVSSGDEQRIRLAAQDISIGILRFFKQIIQFLVGGFSCGDCLRCGTVIDTVFVLLRRCIL